MIFNLRKYDPRLSTYSSVGELNTDAMSLSNADKAGRVSAARCRWS